MPTLSLDERNVLDLMSRGAKATRADTQPTTPWLLGRAAIYSDTVRALIAKGLLDSYSTSAPTDAPLSTPRAAPP